jgi:hypothetical protein
MLDFGFDALHITHTEFRENRTSNSEFQIHAAIASESGTFVGAQNRINFKCIFTQCTLS